MGRKIIDSIQKIAGTFNADNVRMITCTVTAVYQNTRTCDVLPVSGDAVTEINDVLLMPCVDDGMLLLPSIGSIVVVCLPIKSEPFILMYSQIDKVFIIADGLIEIAGSAVNSEKAILGETLKELLGELIDAINNITVLTTTGISSTPLNGSDLSGIKGSLYNVLSNIVKIG
jgi:hypothetical protein